METLVKDLRFALRTLARRPVFTAVAVLSLALGIGANGVVFSMVNGLLWQTPPGVVGESELVRIYSLRKSFDWPLGISYPDYGDLREGTRELLSETAGHTPLNFNLRLGEEPPRVVYGLVVAGDYFKTLDTGVHLGRPFGPAEARSQAPVAVVGYDFWRRHLGGDVKAVGRAIQLDGRSYTVVAVAPKGFVGTEIIFSPDLWVPIESVPRVAPLLGERDADSLRLTGRLRPGVTLEQLASRLEGLSVSLDETHRGGQKDVSFHVMPNTEARIEAGLGGPMKLIASVLLALVGLVLLIACANVANLMLARASTRQREMSLRLALGAGRGRLARQLLVESALLAAAGGAAGMLIAILTVSLIERFPVPVDIPMRLELAPDGRVFLFGTVLSLAAALVFGLVPALRSARTDPALGLRQSRIGAGAGRRMRLGGVLVIAQMALSLILLISAGLFLRSLRSAHQVDVGFNPVGVVAMTADLSTLGRTPGEARDFFRRAKRQLAELPGVDAVASARWVPMDWSAGGAVLGLGRDLGGELGDEYVTLASRVDSDYFATLGTRLVEGRGFTAADEEAGAEVVVVNEALANLVWPGERAVGKELRLGGRDGSPARVVGVAETGKYRLVAESPRPYAFLPLWLDEEASATLLVRSSLPAGSVLALAREELARLEPNLALMNAAPLDATIAARSLGPIELVTALASAFGLVGLALAAIGLYGVMAFIVAQRTREIGVRMALGARAVQLLAAVVGRGLTLAGIGLVFGLVASFLLSRILGSFLVGVSAQDPLTFGAVVALLLLVAALASLAPALRAARIDPARTLRAE